MNKKIITITSLFTVFALGVGVISITNKPYQEVNAYSASSLPATIDLNDCSESTIRNYYSDLNNLDTSERQGTNLLKRLKTILKTGQKYLNYDSGSGVWDAYCIVDRDWNKSPASALPAAAGTYNSSTNKITNYHWGNNSATYENPYLHALYYNRENEPVARAYGDHGNGINNPTGINREHIWPKGAGFDAEAQGGARGDIMHLWAAHGHTNNKHSNYYYGYVDKTRSYDDEVTDTAECAGNLLGYSKTLGGGTKVFEPQDCDKGDIARACFYMVARYNYLSGSDSDGISSNNPNLELVNELSSWQQKGYTSSTTSTGKVGILQDLLEWNRLDPPDEFEIHRNNLCYNNFTNNRNPFIDFPSWADAIWGTVDANGNYNSTPTSYATPASDSISSLTPVTPVFGISNTQLNLEVGDTATLFGRNADGNITWSVANSAIVSLDKTTTANNVNVTVTALSAGSTTITATNGGNSVTCVITVSEVGGQEDLDTLFTADLTNGASVTTGYTINTNASKKTGYYQDVGTNGSETYFKVTNTSPLFASAPNTITFSANLGAGNSENNLINNVEVCLLNSNGDEIASTKQTLTASITSTTKEYTVELPYSSDAYGVKLSHIKTSGYNIRFFSFSLSCEGSTPIGPQPRDYLNNTLPVSYLTADENESGVGNVTKSITFASLGLENGVQYSNPFSIADGVTIKFEGGAHDGKYYTTGSGIRTYSGGSIIIASSYTISKIVFTWSGDSYKPTSDVANPTGYNYQTNTWTGSANSVTLTRPSADNHWRLQSVQVTYLGQTVTVDNVKMRFGASIPVEDWYDIEASWDVDYYGVMFLKYDTLHTTYGYSSIEEAYEDGIRPRADVHTENGNTPLPVNDNLVFTARINITTEDNYGVVYIAAPYLVIDGTHYFLEEMAYSVNSMAQEYLENGGATLSNAALTILAGN